MHDQKKRSKKEEDPAVAQKKKEESVRIGSLYRQTLEAYRSYSAPGGTEKTDGEAALQEMNELLYEVPEFYSLYNYRRKLIRELFAHMDPTAADTTSRQVGLLQSELKQNTAILKRDYKVYGAFSYRHWIVEEWMKLAREELSSVTDPAERTVEQWTGLSSLLAVLHKERENCRVLLELDARNFHTWNYRRWALEQLERAHSIQESLYPSSPQTTLFTSEEKAELLFTIDKIQANFSNYSAWHQRGYIIKKALKRYEEHHQGSTSTGGTEARYLVDVEELIRSLWSTLAEDYSYLVQSIFCDPNDQASWCYAGFLWDTTTRYEKALKAFYATHIRPTVQGTSEEEQWLEEHHGDIKDAFVHATVHLLQEQKELGEEKKCFLPYCFMLNTMRRLRLLLPHTTPEVQERQALYTKWLKDVLEVAPDAEDTVVIQHLRDHLVHVDPLRTEMYQSL